MALLGLTSVAGVARSEVLSMGDVSPDPAIPLNLIFQRLYVGEDEAGSLTVDGGSVLETSGGSLGRRAGSVGTVVLSGAGSTWDSDSLSSPTFYVGVRGVGDLRIQSGARLLSSLGRIASEDDGAGAVTIDGVGSAWVNEGLRVGDDGVGSLTISGGGEATTNGSSRIGAETGSSGTVVVTGAGSAWNTTEYLNVGGDGDGSLTISAGGKVTNAHSNVANHDGVHTDVLVTGAGSEWSNAGSLRLASGAGSGTPSSATLTIEQGGSVASTDDGLIAVANGTTSSVAIDGVDSVWSHEGDLKVGIGGAGTLDVTTGGLHTNTNAIVGFGPQGSGAAIVSGEGSVWRTAEELSVGVATQGDVLIDMGGRLETKRAIIGTMALGQFEVTNRDSHLEITEDAALGGFGVGEGVLKVTDRATADIGGSLTFGYSDGSTGRLEVGDRAEVVVEGEMTLGNAESSSGRLLLDEEAEFRVKGATVIGSGPNSIGVITVAGEAELDAEDDLTFALNAGSSGTLNLETGGVLNLHGNNILVGDGDANFNLFGGTLRNAGTFGTHLNHVSGVVAAGNSPGTMEVLGDYTQGLLATLEVELAANTSAGALAGVGYDFYQIEGAATLRGAIDVRSDAGYSPQGGDAFVVLTAASIEATRLTLEGLPGFEFLVVDETDGRQSLLLSYAIPEPATLWAVAVGLVMAAPRRRG